MYERSDGELVIAIQKGDIFAFEELVKRYQRGLFIFVLRIVHDDATQNLARGWVLVE